VASGGILICVKGRSSAAELDQGVVMRCCYVFALLAFAVGASAQGPSTDVTRAIAEVEARLDKGLALGNVAMLEPLLAEPFTWVHASYGRVDSRAVWLATAARGMALSRQRNAQTEHGATLVAYGGALPHTVVRVARIRLVDSVAKRESWLRQTRVFVRGADGNWRLALGQGVVMYEGPPLDAALHARYAGNYVIGPSRVLELRWDEGSLLATFPNGAETQIFLATPTEEAVRTVGAGSLRFTLGPQGQPTQVAFVRGNQELWRGTRGTP